MEESGVVSIQGENQVIGSWKGESTLYNRDSARKLGKKKKNHSKKTGTDLIKANANRTKEDN